MKPRANMAIIKNKSSTTCKTKTSKDDNANNVLKLVTATELEIKYARHLADNDPKVRKSALKMLRRWFMKRETVLDKDFSILWSGLYITFWMSDKLLVQEECADSIASLSNVLNSKMALKFFESALSRLSMEWYGIDQLRMDKFSMLVRRLLRKSLEVLAVAHYDPELMLQFQANMTNILCSSTAINDLGLKLHLTEIYLEEIAKTQVEDMQLTTVTRLLQPFIRTICVGKDGRLIGEVAKSVFRQLMRQSDEGLEFTDKYKAWRQMGFPGGDISCMQLSKEAIEEDEEEEDSENDEEVFTERVLDPRAGRVNVDLPQIKFDPMEISNLLDDSKFDANSTSKNRKIVNKLINELRTLAKGEFPLSKKQQTVELPQKEKGIIKRSAHALLKFETKLLKNNDKNRKRKIDVTADANESNEKRSKRNEQFDIDSHESNAQTKMDQYKDLKKPFMNGAIKFHTNKYDQKRLGSLQNVKLHKQNRTRTSYERLDIEAANYECKFTRPSGTWYVFKGPEEPTKVTSTKVGADLYIEHDNAPQPFAIRECDVSTMPSRNSSSKSFKSVKTMGTIECTKGDLNSFTTPFTTLMKGDKSAMEKINTAKLLEGNKLKATQPIIKHNSPKLSTPKNRTPINKHHFIGSLEKKVKIALNLNKSQEIHEHELQIKRSPAIPFDANKKPLKPLLKPQCGRFSMSPINPFAKSAKQRRSLMF